MTSVTGDRYLDLLSKFIESNTGPLLDGSLLLKLNPVGLHYLQTRLESLQELEGLRLGAPVDYLRAYVADLGDHQALEQLRRVLGLLTSVKVSTLHPGPSREPSTITLLSFPRLRSLELRGCDLSTSAARGLLELRPFLEKFICYNSADALRHIFAERTVEVQDAQVWSRLIDVSCFGNGMLLMDESLQLLPAVEVLDLSRNRFAKLDNLQKCTKLKILDAGFNHITSLVSVSQNLRAITKLILKNNALVSTRGVQKLPFLEELDLSYNLLSNFRDVELLSELPALHVLWLEGNPLSFSGSYRKEALSYFADPVKLILDGKQSTWWEKRVASKMAARRLKQRLKYGAFLPAESSVSLTPSTQFDAGEIDDLRVQGDGLRSAGPSLASSLMKAKKKSSRLASIQDVTRGLKMASRALELERKGSDAINPQPGFDAESALQALAESREEMKVSVLDLMQQAEILKSSGSSCWLKDLNDIIEKEGKLEPQSPILESEPSIPIQKSSSDSGERSASWQKKRRRRKRVSRQSSSIVSIPASRTSEVSSSRSDDPDEAIASTSASVDTSLRRSLTLGDQPHTVTGPPSNLGDVVSGESFRLTEELVKGKMSASMASSPPQFNQDLLQRRQILERELLQLPLERDIYPLYDSESSSGSIYSNLSDSSDSPPHSPSLALQRFKFDHNFGEAEVPSANRDSEEQLSEADSKKVEVPESAAVGESSIGHATDTEVESTQDRGEHSAETTEQEPSQAGGEGSRSDDQRSDLSRSKPKPHRRIVTLESMRISSPLIHGGTGSLRPGEFSATDRNTSLNVQRSRSISRSSSSASGLPRPRRSVGRLLNSFDSMRSQSIDSNLGSPSPSWSFNSSQSDLLTSISSQG